MRSAYHADGDHYICTSGNPAARARAQLARSAFSRFGKGRHRAGLNYGDCFSYAAAISLGEPLLSKGDDFIHTDVPICDVRSR